ncbi:N1R-like RINg finger host range protein [White-tailed deer poxvirus]|nr:N1R-like RINg finger host range protein [White-tailed deer poxvirus]
MSQDYDINDFIILKCDDIDIIILIVNRYINITKLCNPMKKPFYSWWNSVKNRQIIINTAIEECVKVDKLLYRIYKSKSTKTIYGVYIHYRLLEYILNWISNDYCIKILNTINNFNADILKSKKDNENIKHIYNRLKYEENMYCAILNKNDTKKKNYKKFKNTIPLILYDFEEDYELSKTKECNICMENIYDKEKIYNRYFGIISSCNHVFCMGCITIWRKNKTTCPLCRKKFIFVIKSRFFRKIK